jgi:hypothetical protein
LALTLLTGPLMGSMADAGTIVYDTITGNSYGGGGQWFGYNPQVVQNPPTDGAALLPYMVANSIESPHLSAINATSTPRLSASACAVNDDLDVP